MQNQIRHDTRPILCRFRSAVWCGEPTGPVAVMTVGSGYLRHLVGLGCTVPIDHGPCTRRRTGGPLRDEAGLRQRMQTSGEARY